MEKSGLALERELRADATPDETRQKICKEVMCMLTQTIQLWEDRDDAKVQCYIQHHSQEFQTDVKRPAVIICPGGAYLGTSDREAEPVALRFAAAGYHAFVLRYTTYYKEWVKDFQNPPPANPRSVFPQPLLDLAQTVALVRRHAEEWHISGSDRGGRILRGRTSGRKPRRALA